MWCDDDGSWRLCSTAAGRSAGGALQPIVDLSPLVLRWNSGAEGRGRGKENVSGNVTAQDKSVESDAALRRG